MLVNTHNSFTAAHTSSSRNERLCDNLRSMRVNGSACITTGDLLSLCFGSFYSSVAVQVLLRDSSLGMTKMPNPITGPNAGGPR